VDSLVRTTDASWGSEPALQGGAARQGVCSTGRTARHCRAHGGVVVSCGARGGRASVSAKSDSSPASHMRGSPNGWVAHITYALPWQGHRCLPCCCSVARLGHSGPEPPALLRLAFARPASPGTVPGVTPSDAVHGILQRAHVWPVRCGNGSATCQRAQPAGRWEYSPPGVQQPRPRPALRLCLPPALVERAAAWAAPFARNSLDKRDSI
jgi:hypothetical protein